MKMLKNPLVVLLLGLLPSIIIGLMTFSSASITLIHAIKAAKEEAHEASRPEKPWDFWTQEIENLSKELKESRSELDERAQVLSVREERLNSEKQELEKTRKEIEGMRDKLSSYLVEISDDEAKNIKNLSKTYSELSPKSAVGVFLAMDDTLAVKILSQMKSDVVSALFEEMGKSPDPAVIKRAADYSERLRFYKANKTGSP